MPDLIPVLKKEEIQRKVAVAGENISSDYQNLDLVVVGVLKGAFVFLADLVRHIRIPMRIDFIQVSSYGSDTSSSGNIQLSKKPGIDVRGSHVLIVEDIIDSGLTWAHLIEYFKASGAESVKICAMIDKHERREKEVPIDYACHRVEEGFLVGYGLDYNERYRELPEIYHLKF